MKKCDFRCECEKFVCELPKNHKGDHKQGKFAMFNPDQYAIKEKKSK